MTFPCSSCGCCCKRVNKLYELHEVLGVSNPQSAFYFPYKWNESGMCENYLDNKCSIYETRPNICNVDKTAKLLKLKKKEFYQLNIEACNQMMEEDDIDLKFRL